MCVVIFSITIHNNNHHNQFNNKNILFVLPTFLYKGDYLNVCVVYLTAKNKKFIQIKEYNIGTNGIKLIIRSRKSSIHPTKNKSKGAYTLTKTTYSYILKKKKKPFIKYTRRPQFLPQKQTPWKTFVASNTSFPLISN